MEAWIAGIEGTPEGRNLALGLALARFGDLCSNSLNDARLNAIVQFTQQRRQIHLAARAAQGTNGLGIQIPQLQAEFPRAAATGGGRRAGGAHQRPGRERGIH